MPRIVFASGGPYHDATGKPLPWEISKQPGLDEAGPYVFYPGVPVDVSPSDAAWLMDKNNTRERVFELVRGKGRPADAPDPGAGGAGDAGLAEKQSVPPPTQGGAETPPADPAQVPQTGKPSTQTGPART